MSNIYKKVNEFGIVIIKPPFFENDGNGFRL